MRLLGRYLGKFGQIDIVERKDDGTRFYLEEGIYQSKATLGGELPFQYIRLMAGVLKRSTNVLLLGCGGGTLATLLVRAGKAVTVVDHNPISFQIAQRFFGMPEAASCVCADFRQYLAACTASFDGIAIDISGPGFSIARAFDLATCDSIRARLCQRGRITMNVPVESDVDPSPDRIAARLAGDALRAWVFDHPGHQERNVILACRPELGFPDRKRLALPDGPDDQAWVCRRARLHLRQLQREQQLLSPSS
jgi:SAM-dependent methyltransferase